MLKKALAVSLLLSISSYGIAEDGLIHVKSQHSVAVTTDKLVKVLSAKGMTVFNRIEHSKAAEQIGVTIGDSALVIFGNPKIGSKLMKCAATVAIDLPQKALISADDKQQVWISYNDPKYLQQRHQIKGCDEVIAKVSGALSKFVEAAAN
ncbi:MAG: DUF302 domain-containing protein [Oceanospirillaceae bacterium]|nr:DUF302 domain-containing protein [Colwellia sp.]NQZ33793.1 DUF302 domain-containing protein [Oceanospirillaceae bacterium]